MHDPEPEYRDGVGYDRPNQTWSCGLEQAGCPCPTGPSARGKCPALGECRPVRDGDRWICNRSTLRGGPCESTDGGPSADGVCCRVAICQPKRSLRSQRGRWLAGCGAFSLGVLLMLLGASGRNELIVPGPLSSHHAQVLREVGANRCEACHPGANHLSTDLTHDAWHGEAVTPTSANGHPVTQSSLCLDCHTSLKTQNSEPLLAHGLRAETLGSLQVGNPSLALAAFATSALGKSHEDQLACAVCHQEHRGADHDLSAMTDARCQACHSQRFDSFAMDHPDFNTWPVRRRTRIAFNHASHETQHFAKASQAFNCQSCHLPDATGDLTLRPTYQAACANCHEEEIKASFREGITLFALPTLDTEALAAAERPIENWPTQARGDFDGEASVLMKLMLATDPIALKAMQLLGEDFTFFDVDSEDEQQVVATGDLVNSLRRWIDEIQEEGHTSFEYRLRKLLQADALPVPLADFVSRLPVELIDQLQATWLGKQPPVGPFDAIEDRHTGGGWLLDEQRLSLSYLPSGHDDPFLKAWLEVLIALPEESAELRDACLTEFTRPGAPGQCLECHSIDSDSLGKLTIHWKGRDRRNEPRAFTHFSHRPHLTQSELADCSACHALDPTADLSAAYAGYDPQRFGNEFISLKKADCASCHQPHAAGDQCTQCHNYHVDPLSVPSSGESLFRSR